MPLYIDYHEVPEGYTLQDLRHDHSLDLKFMEKYEIQTLQYWFNQKGGTVFCLIEAPNPESCHSCHYEACGETSCNLQEVVPLHLKLFMGEGFAVDEHDMILTQNGNADSANRTIMVCDIQKVKLNNAKTENRRQPISTHPKNFLVDYITRFGGRFIEYDLEEGVIGVFDSPTDAIKCAGNLKDDMRLLQEKHGKNSEWDIVFRISLNIGQPLEAKGGFFETPIKLGKRLCMAARPNDIVLSTRLVELFKIETESSLQTSSLRSPKVLTDREERFVYELFDLVEQNLSKESFNVSVLSKLIGKSRPQLYRKVTSLMGISPHEFIKEVRLRKAWRLVKAKKGNISEITFEIGYSNPSHFAKIFREKFGYTPSQLGEFLN